MNCLTVNVQVDPKVNTTPVFYFTVPVPKQSIILNFKKKLKTFQSKLKNSVTNIILLQATTQRSSTQMTNICYFEVGIAMNSFLMCCICILFKIKEKKAKMT